MQKFIEIVRSPRAQMAFAIALLQALQVFNVITGEQAVSLTNIVQALLAVIITIGTVDKNTGQARVEAAKAANGITAVSIPSNTSMVTATTLPKKTAKKK